MSRFYGSLQGNRGMATRQGTGKSGIGGHIRGWNVGIEVSGYVNDADEDSFEIYITSGSNGNKPKKLIGTFRERDLK